MSKKPRDSDRWSSGRQALGVYLGAQVTLLGGSYLLPGASQALLQLLVMSLGIGALIAAIAVRRPRRRGGWWLIASGGLLALLAELGFVLTHGLATEPTGVTELWLPALGISASATLALGLVALGRRRAATLDGWLDASDAPMAAVGAFLLAWVFYINPALTSSTSLLATFVAITVPVSALLVFAAAVHFMIKGGWRTWSGRLLLLAVLTGIMAAGVTSHPVGADVVQVSPALTASWVAYGVLLGAAGLAPDFGTVGASMNLPELRLRPWRMAFYASLALLTPAYIAIEFSRAPSGRLGERAILVPVICAAVIFLLLLVRLAVIAKVARERADALKTRTSLLARAAADQRELQSQLRYRASHDPLTGLLNRSALTDRMDLLHNADEGSGPGLALLMIDLDSFKEINDTFGHPVGDQILTDAAQRLRSAVPDDAFVVRLGGDEFAVLIEGGDAEQAPRYADGVLDVMRSPYFVSGHEHFLSASVGMLVIDRSVRPPDSSAGLRDVDQALYAAKSAGKDRVVEFDPRLQAGRLDQPRLVRDLRYALSHDQLLLHYQPIVALDSGAIVGVEALVRWRPSNARLVGPGVFIPVAEKTGLITEIGAWVLRQACRDACAWYGPHGVTVGVNVSARQLDDPEFAEFVLATLADAGLPGAALVLEITEGSLIATETGESVHAQLRRLREQGVCIAIDDFGTGYSSLSYVTRLPVDIVKIDSSFVQHSPDPDFPQQTRQLLRAILDLVSSLGLEAIAEGTETREQADMLRDLGCPKAQGHYFYRPMSADRVFALFRDRSADTREAAPASGPR